MSDFYSDMRNLASNLLSEFKQGETALLKITPGTGPADDPGPQSSVTIPFDGTVRGVKFRYIDGSQVLGTDLQVTAPGTLDIRDVSGFVQVDGQKYKIVKVIPKPAAGQPVAYDIIIRG